LIEGQAGKIPPVARRQPTGGVELLSAWMREKRFIGVDYSTRGKFAGFENGSGCFCHFANAARLFGVVAFGKGQVIGKELTVIAKGPCAKSAEE